MSDNDNMVEIEFNYEKMKKQIKTNKTDTLIEVINKSNFNFLKDNNFIIIAHDKKIEEDETIESIMTLEDKNNKKLKIILIPLNNEQNNIKEIFCPGCLEPCKFTINNYRINLCHSSGLHNNDNLKLSEFNKMQSDLQKKLNCNSCKNTGMYKCSQCNFYLCNKCKDIHKNQEHKIISNEEIKYVCQKHESLFIKFCAECDKDICDLCEKEHTGHYIYSFKELYPNMNELYKNLRKLKQSTDIFNKNVKEIILKLNKVVENMEILYHINENIINTFSNNYTNYTKLLNVFDINDTITKEIERIENCDYGYNINKILYLYNEMEENNDEIEINYEFLNIPTDDDIPLQIFGDKFISNNLNKCKILFNENEYELSHTFYSSDMPSLYSKELSIILKGVNNITNMSSMFEGCNNIKSIYGINNLNTSKVMNMKNLFNNCKDLINIPNLNNWNTSNVLNMEGLFSNDYSLKRLPDISKWDTSNVISMMNLFYNCENILSIPDISKWNTTNVIDMRYMFCNCKKLLSLPDISDWNLINVKYITSLFKDCLSLLFLPDISKWNTSNVISMNDLFQNCNKLTVIPDISKWNVENVSDLSYSFMGCLSLISLPDLSLLDIKKCKNLDGMFINCLSLSSLPDLEKWNKYKINNKHSMFKRCFNSLNIPLLES